MSRYMSNSTPLDAQFYSPILSESGLASLLLDVEDQIAKAAGLSRQSANSPDFIIKYLRTRYDTLKSRELGWLLYRRLQRADSVAQQRQIAKREAHLAKLRERAARETNLILRTIYSEDYASQAHQLALVKIRDSAGYAREALKEQDTITQAVARVEKLIDRLEQEGWSSAAEWRQKLKAAGPEGYTEALMGLANALFHSPN